LYRNPTWLVRENKTKGKREQQRIEEKNNEDLTGKEIRGFRSERQAYPRKRKGMQSAILRAGQTERSSKPFWDAKELDRDWSSGERTGIASQPLGPGETIMGPLSTGKRGVSDGKRGLCWLHLDLHPLMAEET
jgi:hypothetical protein